ncbi:hypothetical protein [Frankia sp. AiPs1]|nr:hypothetical protein [Frankia sp. AiPs1]
MKVWSVNALLAEDNQAELHGIRARGRRAGARTSTATVMAWDFT